MHIQKKTIRAIMEIATGILAIIVIYFVIRHVSMRYSHNVTSVTDTAEVEKRTEFPEESINITINGTQYKFLHNVKTYLFLGTDASGNEEGVGDDYQGTMAVPMQAQICSFVRRTGTERTKRQVARIRSIPFQNF